MLFLALGSLCGLVSFICAIIILVHAFTKGGVLQGFLCLCIPFYILYYAFARFEHPKKNQILIGLLGGVILEWVFLMMGGFTMPHPPVQ